MSTRDEAKVRVSLETGEAKRQIGDLMQFSSSAAKRLGSIIGDGVRAVGLGAGIGAGIAAIRGPAAQGFGDVFSEALGGIGSQIQYWALGDLVPEARASSKAREETISAYATIAGMSDKIPPEARNFYAQTKSLMMEVEKGRSMFERDDAFRGPGIDDIIAKLVSSLKAAFMEGFEYLADKLTPTNWFK